MCVCVKSGIYILGCDLGNMERSYVCNMWSKNDRRIRSVYQQTRKNQNDRTSRPNTRDLRVFHFSTTPAFIELRGSKEPAPRLWTGLMLFTLMGRYGSTTTAQGLSNARMSIGRFLPLIDLLVLETRLELLDRLGP